MNEKNPEVVALKYDGDGAPRVTAKGRGEVARQILRLAKEHDIPLYQDAELSALLSKVELGHEIPEQLYLAVAKVISFVFQLNKDKYRDINKTISHTVKNNVPLDKGK